MRLRIQTPSAEAWGAAAELLAPKWFDKDPALSDEQNIQQLRYRQAAVMMLAKAM